MKLHRFLLLLSLNVLVIACHSPKFKVVNETKDYILKECDSVYYYTHGIEPKDDYVLGKTKIQKVNGVLKLPLDNGKFVEFRDTITMVDGDSIIHQYRGYNNKEKNYLVVWNAWVFYNYILINKKDGNSITLNGMPHYSPSHKYYAYRNGTVEYDVFGNVVFGKLAEKNEILIHYDYTIPDDIKWVDDKSFVYYTDVDKSPREDTLLKRYYLLQIKL